MSGQRSGGGGGGAGLASSGAAACPRASAVKSSRLGPTERLGVEGRERRTTVATSVQAVTAAGGPPAWCTRNRWDCYRRDISLVCPPPDFGRGPAAARGVRIGRDGKTIPDWRAPKAGVED